MRRGVLAFGITFVLAVSGVATAAVFASDGDATAEETEQDAGIHGGPIERFQEAASCDLAAVSSLPGNWTHGDYVDAVAAAGDPILIREAAHSDCGKPMVSVGHGQGPPEHAQAHGRGKGHANGEAEDQP